MSKIVAKANRPAYLANVLSIAKIGGKVAATESLALRSIMHRIGGTQDDLVAAGKMLGVGRYQLQLPDSLNERMDNLQDMIMVAIADGNLSPTEAGPIEEMAKAMKYAQADVDLAMRRAKLALKQIGREPRTITSERQPPPIPGKAPKRPAKAASQKAPPQPKPPPPPIPAPVEKEEEPPAAVDSGLPPVPEPTPKAEPVPEMKPVEQAIEPVAEEEPPPAEPSGNEESVAEGPDTVSGSIPNPVKACMQRRAESENPETYCFGVPDGSPNPWGCRLANMPWEPGAPWMELGSFRDDETFVFDKHAIAERLTSGLSAALSCPHMDTDYTEAVFHSLPDRALIGPRWTYRAADSDDAHAVNVSTTEYIHGCAVSTNLTVSGVDPIGTRDAMRLIGKAGREA